MLEKILKELPRRACEHENVITTRNYGLERQVCESCGHVTVQLFETSEEEAQLEDDDELEGTVHHPRPGLATTTAEARANNAE